MSGKVLPWLLGGLVLLGAAGGSWWGWAHRPGAAATAAEGAASAASGVRRPGGPGGPGFGGGGTRVQPVSVGQVRRQDIRVTVQAIGSIAASNTAVVKSKIEGELKALHFKEGQLVKAGALLAELDDRALRITLSQTEGQLARDSAQLQNARLDLARFKDLLSKDGIARQQVDTQEALVRQLQGTVQSDQALVDNARLQLSYTRIVAPISGRIGFKQADLGNVVRPGDAAGLLTIAQTQPVNVVFAVPDQHLPRIGAQLHAGQVLQVEAWDRDQKQRLAVGQVASTDNAIDAATGTVKLKASFPNADGGLFPNQFVNVKLQLSTLEGLLAVPAAAVLRNAEGNYVYRVTPEKTVTVQRIQVEASEGDWVGVRGDLQPGDTVVTDGVDRLREGTKVDVIRPQAGGAGPGARRTAPSGAASAPQETASQTGRSEERRPAATAATAVSDAARPERRTVQGASGGSAAADNRPEGRPAGGFGGGPGGGGPSPERLAEILGRLPPDVAEKVKAMSPDERRAWFQQRREERARREAGGQ